MVVDRAGGMRGVLCCGGEEGIKWPDLGIPKKDGWRSIVHI